METEFSFLDTLFAQNLFLDKKLEFLPMPCGESILVDAKEKVLLCLKKLMRSAREGHLCIEREQLGEDIDLLPARIVEEGTQLFPKTPIVRWNNLYYLQKNWVCETYILQQARKLRKQRIASFFDPQAFEKNLCQAEGLFFAQREAIRQVLQSALTLICGGPGTGKTYTASRLVQILCSSMDRKQKERLRICLAAPTGKASSHLGSVLSSLSKSDFDLEISTLHRLLKLQPGGRRLFSGCRIDADLIIVDEASMVDASLLAHLLEAIGEETSLVLIGDPDQLPPIGTKSLFAEMSKQIAVHLERCVRTDESKLQQLAASVKLGDSVVFFRLLSECCMQDSKESHPIEWRQHVSWEELFSQLQPLVSDVFPDPAESVSYYEAFRILNAMRQGSNGSEALNQQILKKLQSFSKWWAAPIIATVNDSYVQIYNGMSGILIGHPKENPKAYFPDPVSKEMRCFDLPPPYELSFCLSIHKSQGSEFGQVTLLFPEGSEGLGREALYTAITRAKRKVQIVGNREILQKMLTAHASKISGFTKRWAN